MKLMKKLLVLMVLIQCALSQAVFINGQYFSDLGAAILTTHDASPERVEQLINNGADVNEKQSEHQATPLILLALNFHVNPENQERVAKLLLNAGADISIRDNSGQTALDYANQWYRVGIIKAINEHIKRKLE